MSKVAFAYNKLLKKRGIMLSQNIVIISGRLTQDPEIREVGSNKTKLAKIGIAHNQEYFGAKGGNSRNSIFIDIQIWDKPANFVEKYLRKGDFVAVEGSLCQENWKDKTGAYRSKLAIKAKSIQKLKFAKKGEEDIPEEDVQEIPDVPPQSSRYTPDDYPAPRVANASNYKAPGAEPMYDDDVAPF